MKIEDLPKVGGKFHVNYSAPGQKSLSASLSKLARKNYQFQNLDKDNVKTISEAVGKYEKSIRKYGGFSTKTESKIARDLRKTYNENPNDFSLTDFKTAKKIVHNYTLAEQTRMKKSALEKMKSKLNDPKAGAKMNMDGQDGPTISHIAPPSKINLAK